MNRWRSSSKLALGACLALFMASGLANAQLSPDSPSRIPAFGRSLASGDDTTSLVLNPANLAFMPASELRWSSVYLDEDAETEWQGHAIALGLPLPIVPLATGIRFDVLNPPDAARRYNYQWLTWGLALRAGDTASMGFSLQRSYSELAAQHALSSWSFGMSTRPADFLGMAFAAHHINGPRNDDGGRIRPAYDVGLVLRPVGSRLIQLGLEARYQDDLIGYWIPRATLGIGIPYIGQIRGDVSVIDPREQAREREWIASAALAFDLNGPAFSSELAAGSIFGNGLGQESRYRAYANVITEVALKGYREQTGIDVPTMAVRIRIEETPGAREHVALLRSLWAISEDPATAAVVFEVRTSPGDSLAHVEELRDAIALLKESGKRVLCHLEDASGTAVYLCSAADRVLINPAGGVRFAGLRTRHFYIKNLLDKLGIKAEIVRIGDHKSAPEMFTREGPTDAARQDDIDLLQQFERRFVAGVATSRGIAPELLRERIQKGPFVASEAKMAGLVDGYAYDDELQRAADALVGSKTVLVDDPPAPRVSQHFGAVSRIALIYVDGDMVDGRSETIPLLGTRLTGSYTIAETLRQMRADPLVGAIVLRIESPGGSSVAAEVMWREVQVTAASKPVIVSMGGVAASGGYYVAAPANRVFANALSITGSIGVYYGKADISELMRKIGVNVETYKTAPRADAETLFRPYTDDERREIARKVGQFYAVFLSRVSIGRKMSEQAVDKVGRGRVWTGEQALRHHLVDEIGGLRQALEYARKMAGLPDHAPIVELPPPDDTLLGRLLGVRGIRAQDPALPLPGQMKQLVRALGPFLVHPSDRPLARMQYVLIEP